MTSAKGLETERLPERLAGIEAFFSSLPQIPGIVFKRIDPYRIGAWEAKYNNPIPVILGRGEFVAEGEWADCLAIGASSLVLIRDGIHPDLWLEHSLTSRGLRKASLRRIAKCFSSPVQVLLLGGSPIEGVDINSLRESQQKVLVEQMRKIGIEPEIHCVWNPVQDSLLSALVYAASLGKSVEVYLGMGMLK